MNKCRICLRRLQEKENILKLHYYYCYYRYDSIPIYYYYYYHHYYLLTVVYIVNYLYYYYLNLLKINCIVFALLLCVSFLYFFNMLTL
jgi:hypothetical protein